MTPTRFSPLFPSHPRTPTTTTAKHVQPNITRQCRRRPPGLEGPPRAETTEENSSRNTRCVCVRVWQLKKGPKPQAERSDRPPQPHHTHTHTPTHHTEEEEALLLLLSLPQVAAITVTDARAPPSSSSSSHPSRASRRRRPRPVSPPLLAALPSAARLYGQRAG